MIELKQGFVGMRCPVCERNVIESINLFQFASGTVVHCPDCGTAILSISKNLRKGNFSINCFACNKTHTFKISKKSFLSGTSAAFGCTENIIDVLFTGTYEDVDNSLFQLSAEIKKLSQQYYENLEKKYGEYSAAAIKIIEEKAKNKRIICLCGSYEFNIKLAENGIYIVCPKCGGSEFIPAQSEDDINALINRRSILIK